MSTLPVNQERYLYPAVRLAAVGVGEAVFACQLRRGDRPLVPTPPILVGGDGRDTPSDISRRLRFGEPWGSGGVAVGAARIQRDVPVVLGNAPVVEHHLRAQPPGCDDDGRRAERCDFVADAVTDPVHRDL